MAALLCTTGGLAADAQPIDPQREAEVELLIEQLGHANFGRRTAATERLLAIGLPALAALQRGGQHPDREVRDRCAHIVLELQKDKRRRRLAAFLARQDLAPEDQLPGWPQFARLAGDDESARALFAEMFRVEWELLAHLDNSPQEASQALANRCGQLEQARSLLRQSPTLPSVASLLLMASQTQVSIPDEIGAKLYFLCNQVPSFRRALEDEGKVHAPLRALVGGWIGQAQGTVTAYYCLNLSIRYDLPEGLGLAETLLAHQNTPARHKELAILTIAKLGDTTHIPILEQIMEDQSVCQNRLDPKSKVTFQSQVRDVALAAIIQLSGEDPKQFGFHHLQTNSMYVFVLTSIGFASDEQRMQSRAMWADFCRRQ
jgi:hypothetical protein